MIPKLEGSHPWLVLLCTPKDRVTAGRPPLSYFQDLIAGAGAGGLFDYWSQVSGGRMNFAGSRVLGWYTLDQTVAEVDDRDRHFVIAEARRKAMNAGQDISGYPRTLVFVMGSGHFGAALPNVISGLHETPGQIGWRWCSKCGSLVQADGTPGRCAGGAHHAIATSSHYAVEPYVRGQVAWRRCSKCDVLVREGSAKCPAGGMHELTTSDRYRVRTGTPGPHDQAGWRRCRNCLALAFQDVSREPEPCPAADRHDYTGSERYNVPLAWVAPLGGLAHETGHGLGLDHAFGTSRTGDFGNDSRPGAYGDVTDIMSWAKAAHFTAPRYTPGGPGLSAATLHKLGWLDHDDVVRLDAGSGNHTVELGPLYGSTQKARMVLILDAPRNRIYVASFRTPTGWDRGLGEPGVVVHVQRSLYAVGHEGWYHCAKCEGLVHAGPTRCPAGGHHDAIDSADYRLEQVGSPAAPAAGQNNWRWCRKCSGLAFAGKGTNGRCPAGEGHDFSRSGDYVLAQGGEGQPAWRWCNKCQALSYDGHATKGTCPGGGFHDHTGSGYYPLARGAAATGQNHWRACSKCQGLFFAGHGVCQKGGAHDLAGSDFAPTMNVEGAGGQPGWNKCSKCLGLAFHDGSRAVGKCPAGGTHEHAASGSYALPTDPETAHAEMRWYCCKGCNSLTQLDGAGQAGSCKVLGHHIPYSGTPECIVAYGDSPVEGNREFRRCTKCRCLVLGNNPGGCAAGNSHDTSGSPRFVVRTDPQSLVREQSSWRTCSQCSVLMALASSDGSNEKPCPASSTGKPHTPQGEYFLTFKSTASHWRWCSKCEALAFWDESRPPGPCPAGGNHEHGSSTVYTPPSLEHDAGQVLAHGLRASSKLAVPDTDISFEVVALDDVSASLRISTGVLLKPLPDPVVKPLPRTVVKL